MAASFRDLNGNGRLDPYEDPRRPVDERVEDLLARMTLEEKAGLMFHPPISMQPDGSLLEEAGDVGRGGTTELVAGLHLNHFNVFDAPEPRLHAEWQNRLQALAEATRLGIPVTISSDPRHSVTAGFGASWFAGGFSHWPEPIGLAAAGDEELVRRVRRHRAAGVPGGRDSRRAPPDGRPRDRAALGSDHAHLRRGRGARGATRRRLHSRLPGRAARTPLRRLHDEALPRRRPAAGRRGPALPVREGAGLSRRECSTTTSCRSRLPSRPGPPRSCPTTGVRSGSASRRSASGSTAA